MVLDYFDVAKPEEGELIQRLGHIRKRDYRNILPEQRRELDQDPDSHLQLLDFYKVPCRLRMDGRASRLRELLARGHVAIVFLGAKALRRRGILRRGTTLEMGYQPVVVTNVGRWRVRFHDPSRKDGANRSVRRGRHVLYQAGTFEAMWSVWQGGMLPLSYLTLRTPDLSPTKQLPPWVFIETWRGSGN
jgi:hypothetical protein